MSALIVIAAFAIGALGFLAVVGLLLLSVTWTWERVLRRRKDWRTLLLLSAKALFGDRYNRDLMLPALKEWIGDSDVAAWQVLDFVKRIRPEAEYMWEEKPVDTARVGGAE